MGLTELVTLSLHFWNPNHQEAVCWMLLSDTNNWHHE